jgi:NADPH-dependent 2,4-dienoyl-CoA reductase/sulfur reductase-like enzyme
VRARRLGDLGRPTSLTARVAGEPVDVAIVGGGMAGISGALAARRRGARVVLFEPGPIGGT